MDVQFAPSPARIESCLLGYEICAALWTAIDIDLFTAIEDGHQTATALAGVCQSHERGVRILADYFVLKGFLTKQGERYQLTRESRFYLSRQSPGFLGKTADFRHSPFVWSQYGRLTECVRQGGASEGANVLEPNHDLWIRFARAMGDQMGEVARATAPLILGMLDATEKPRKILDVAAGHGMFGIAFAKEDPTCEVVAQDWPRILEVTCANAVAQGVAGRLTVLPGDIMRVEVGGGYDVVVISNLIHYLDRAASVRLLRKARAALKPGGVLSIAEYALNEDRVSPLYANFGLFVLAMAPAGDVYTVNEILAMCGEAGFTDYNVWDVPVQRLIAVSNRRGAVSEAARPVPHATGEFPSFSPLAGALA